MKDKQIQIEIMSSQITKNSLPFSLKRAPCITVLQSGLKTYLLNATTECGYFCYLTVPSLLYFRTYAEFAQ